MKLKIYYSVVCIDVKIISRNQYQVNLLTSNIHTLPFKLLLCNDSSRIMRCHVGFDVSFPLTTHRCIQTINMTRIQSRSLPQAVNC